ncbi:hypothetical protein MGI18_26590 [Bacillus sp. OVS6]|nr:hypothetical protein MGI18_26590 [Bacillus sp. OVS6]
MAELLIGLIGCTGLFYLLFILPTQWLKVEHIDVPLGIDKRSCSYQIFILKEIGFTLKK